jgi:hypothetical protein
MTGEDLRHGFGDDDLALLHSWLMALDAKHRGSASLQVAIAETERMSRQDREWLEKLWLPALRQRGNVFGRLLTFMREAEALSADGARSALKMVELELAARQTNRIPDPPRVPSNAKYRKQWVRCGKAGCRCASGRGHGPYWYRYWKEGTRTRSVYVGRQRAGRR